MKFRRLLLLPLGLMVAAQSAAQDGINLSWDDCGSYGTSIKQFACNTNTGADVMVVSFRSGRSLPDLHGFAAIVDVRSAGTLPNWWLHGDPYTRTACRDTFGLDADVGPTSCPSAFINPVYFAGAIGAQYIEQGPGAIRLFAQTFQDPPGFIDKDVELTAMRVIITHYKTTGPQACSGCEVPVCIVLNELQLFRPDYLGDNPKIVAPFERNHVTWQSTIPTCPASTPTRRSTWGTIKGMYR